MSEQVLNKIEKAITSDPGNQNWIKLVLYPFVFFGLLATLVSAYIEYKFFTGIFEDFAFWGLVLVIAFEGAKIGAIIIYEYVKKHSEIKFSSGLTSVIYTLRITLIIFSTICSFSKISQYLNNPNYKKELEAKTITINNEYKSLIEKEDAFLKGNIDELEEKMDAEANVFINGQWKGPRYAEKKINWEKAIKDREKRIAELVKERDNKIETEGKNLYSDPKSQNQILVGIYNTFQNIGIGIEFKRFYSIFVVLIAFFTTLILELIIWAVFGIIGAIYEGVFKAKIDSFIATQETLENTRAENFREQAKTFNILQNIKNTFKKGFSKTKSFVDEVEQEN